MYQYYLNSWTIWVNAIVGIAGLIYGVSADDQKNLTEAITGAVIAGTAVVNIIIRILKTNKPITLRKIK